MKREPKRNPAPEPETIAPTAAPQPKPEPAEVPEWVKDTPQEGGYEMHMWAPDGEIAEEIEITRTEYIKLKAHLAVMRGYVQVAA